MQSTTRPRLPTDHQIGAWFLVAGSLIFIVGIFATFSDRYETFDTFAKQVQLSMDMIHCLCTFAGAVGFLYLAYNDGWYKLFLGVKNFDARKEPWYRRFFIGNALLVSVWLWYLPTLVDFVFPILGYVAWQNSGVPVSKYNYGYLYVAAIAGMSIVVYLMFFMVYACFPENMRQNKGRGPNHSLYYVSVTWVWVLLFRLVMYRSLSIPDDKLSEKVAESSTANEVADNSARHSLSSTPSMALKSFMALADTTKSCSTRCRLLFGSDFTIAMLLYLLCSCIGSAYAVIMMFDNYDDIFYIGGLACTVIYTFGCLVTWWASYPHRLKKDNFSGSYEISSGIVWLYERVASCTSTGKKSSASSVDSPPAANDMEATKNPDDSFDGDDFASGVRLPLNNVPSSSDNSAVDFGIAANS